MIVGTCSICGGPVEVPEALYSIEIAIPRCRRCGAKKRNAYGPVIDMEPSPIVANPPTVKLNSPFLPTAGEV